MADSGRSPAASVPEASREAVGGLVADYGGQLYTLGLRFCGNPQDAEDLVQEVFLQALRGWEAFEGRASPKTWLYTIASRVCQRMHRRRAGEPAHLGSLNEALPFGDERIAIVAADQEAPLQAQLRSEARQQVEGAIAALPDDYRIPLVLKEIVGLSVPEVSAVLGLEEGTVKSRVHRARLSIRSAVDRALPRQPQAAGPPAYPLQVCLDLLTAKQEALDRGVAFDRDVICERCRSVFASLDLAQDVCRDLGAGELPVTVRERLQAALHRA